MHRADPYASRPPRAGGAAATPSPLAVAPPAHSSPHRSIRARHPWTPRRARVTIREIPGSALPRRARYHVHPLDVVTLVLGIAVLLAILWPR